MKDTNPITREGGKKEDEAPVIPRKKVPLRRGKTPTGSSPPVKNRQPTRQPVYQHKGSRSAWRSVSETHQRRNTASKEGGNEGNKRSEIAPRGKPKNEQDR